MEALLNTEWLQVFLRHPALWASLGKLAIVWVFIGLALAWRLTLIEQAMKFLKRPEGQLYNAILRAAKNPTAFFLIFLGLLLSAAVVPIPFIPQSVFITGRILGFVIVLGWLWINATTVAELYYLKLRELKVWDKHTVGTLIRLIRLLVLAAILLVCLQAFGVPLSGLLAFGGAGTLIVGFASKDLLANCAGAMTIYLDRPFNVGDWIASPEKNIEGIVEHIGWRLTRIRRFNKQPLYVPNALFSTIIIENPSRMTNRQIKETFALRYSDASKLPMLIKTLQSFLDQHPDLDHKCTTFIALNHVTPYSLDCALYCFTKTTEWIPYLRVQEALLLGILDILQQHGCEVAIPTHDLKINEGGLAKSDT